MAKHDEKDQIVRKCLPQNSPLRQQGYTELCLERMSMGDERDQKDVGRRLGLLQARLYDVEDALRHGRCIMNHNHAMEECVDCCYGQRGHGKINLQFEHAEIKRQLEALQEFINQYREMNEWGKVGL